ncbi:hypothetical protein Hanom_Chr02g00177171 [Helianthus anomalus]
MGLGLICVLSVQFWKIRGQSETWAVVVIKKRKICYKLFKQLLQVADDVDDPMWILFQLLILRVDLWLL